MSTIREGADRPEDRSRRDTILKLLALLPATYAGSLAVVGRAEAQASPPGQDSDFTPPGQGGDGPPGCGPSGGRPSKCDSSSSDSSHSDDSSSDSSHSDDSSSENGTTPSEESGSDEDSPRSASVRAECRAIEREYAGQPISAIQPPSRQQFYLENCYCENIRSRFGGQPLSSLSPADQSWFRQYCLPSR